jgi:hypothetical protein
MMAKQNRSQPEQVNIRMTAAQRDLLERATAKLVAHIPGGRAPLGPWLLELGLAEARRILGEKKER